MSNIIDLDLFVPEPKSVTLGGRTYSLPGDLPMETFLRIAQIDSDEELNDLQRLTAMVETIADLFAVNAADPDRAAIRAAARKSLGQSSLDGIMQMTRRIYPPRVQDEAPEPDAEVAADPSSEAAPSPGTTTTS